MNRSRITCVCGRLFPFKSLNLKYLAILILAMVSLPFLAYGQTATIVGTITDPSGAVVPNVTITITHVDTGRVTVFTSNDAGQYVAPDIPIGNYTVKASVTGFKVAERTGIVLNTSERQRIDFQLALGTTAQSVSVEANPVAVQTDTGEVSTLVTGQQLTQLATNGRSIYTLVNLTTGASSLQGDFQTPTPVGGNNNSSFNGNRPAHNLYLMDGGEDDDRGGAGSFIVMPSMDAFAEVQTLTSNYDAQYGLSSGATFQTVLKSGTKSLHASAWEFVRNNALDARNPFNPAPATVAIYLFAAEGLRYLWQQGRDGERAFVVAVCITVVVAALTRQTGSAAINSTFALPDTRKLITQQLERKTGECLVLVSYDLAHHR